MNREVTGPSIIWFREREQRKRERARLAKDAKHQGLRI
jgi:hypothetical protein